MPEIPDIDLYLVHLERRFRGQVLEGIRLASPFLLRSVMPPLASCHGKTVSGFRRLGKRIVWELEDDLFLVFHLMVAGRFHLKPAGAKLGRRNALAAMDFPSASIFLTEAGTKKRASLHLVRGESGLLRHDPGGLEVLAVPAEVFETRLRSGNHTLKRALCDPRFFAGIGNSYSDEILHAARLSPMKRTRDLSATEVARLFEACRRTLQFWSEKLRREQADRFPEHVTAFHADMAVHGRYRQPCPDCGAPVQRIVYGEREMNYCADCQTGGRVLADRGLSRLLKSDWPKTVEAWEDLWRPSDPG